MKKTLALKPGDPVTCMRRYYLGKLYHGEVVICNPFSIVVHFYHTVEIDEHGGTERRGDSVNYLPDGKRPDEPCSLIPGHITPEPLTLPEKVEFEAGDRVLAWSTGFEFKKEAVIYIKALPDENCHLVRHPGGTEYKRTNVSEYSDMDYWSQGGGNQTAAQPEPETDELKEGDWCAFWDVTGDSVVLRKYRNLINWQSQYNHVDTDGSSWVNARKLKPADLSPELWEIVKGDKTDIQ